MQLTNATGTATVIHNNVVKILSYEPGYYSDTYAFDGGQIDMPDYDKKFDVYYHPSDDGKTFYDTIHVIQDSICTTGGLQVPPAAIFASAAAPHLQAMMTQVAMGKIHADDLTFAINTLNIPTWMHNAWRHASQDADAAIRQILRDVFRQ